ncbi:DUF2746 domain-containing protein [Streptomyces sp. NRRL F-5123]|uniref:DUF2746 domain-containing protein n=1 Tax=Streptomyces sp. NRRL F-5123 TaxID=1463856 RepID=UPI0004E12E08|nr:DUF2746 domain-containing protein [Streptomyces sp. NRRL F-5123]
MIDPNVQVSLITAGGAVAVAGLGLLVEYMRRQVNAMSEVRENVQVARDHVANTHTTNLRDDLDSVAAQLNRVLELQELHGRELGALREDMAHERRERLAVASRLDDHMAATT